MADKVNAMRVRKFTYKELVGYAEYYAENRYIGAHALLMERYFAPKNTEPAIVEWVRKCEEAVEKFTGHSIDEIRGGRKYGKYIRSRQLVAIVALSKYTLASKQIAAVGYGGYNNVRHLHKRAKMRYELDNVFASDVRRLLSELEPVSRKIFNNKEEDNNGKK